MRISGIVSGMDTDTMVQSMMKAERMKLTRFEQSKQIALWRQESYNSINKMFANFILNTKKDIGLKSTNSKGVSFDKSYTSLDYVKKATSSNELAATVSSTSKAVNGSFSIEVEKLAKGASFTSKKITGSLGKDTIKFEIAHKDSSKSNVEIIVNQKKDKDGNPVDLTMGDVVAAINAKKDETGVTAFYDSGNNRLFMQTTETGENAKVSISNVGGFDFINLIGFIDTKEDSYTSADPDGAKYIAAQKAQVKLNGITLEYDLNKFELNGVNIELKTEGASTNINVSTNVDGIMDKVKKLVDDYNALIDVASLLLNEKKYPSYKPLSTDERNGMKENDVKLWDEKAKSGLLNSDETINRTLQSMRNNLYKDLGYKVTMEGTKKVYDGFGHITQIGISTEAYARGSAGGKLQIDEDKLRKAIEQDPEGVMELLFNEPAAKPYGVEKPKKESYTDEAEFNNAMKEYELELRAYEKDQKIERNANSGIFTRIYDDLIDGMKSIIEKSGTGGDSDLYRNVKSNILIDFVTTKSSVSDIDKSIAEMNRKMDNLNILFAKKEDSYYAKFTQMEKYMQQMNSQSGWLSQQFMR